MSNQQLWRRAYALTIQAHPLRNQGPQDLDLTLQQLQAVLEELELRGEQLSFLPETQGTRQPQ